jgi:pyruvate decarboxylase
LAEIGVSDVFMVPGDFNLLLLDELLADPEIQLRGCCNELNAGYAADGYARCRGVGACVVTFTVGGLSVINAIAGAYSENLPLICLVGGPNSNDYGTNHILHHTLGLPDFSQEYRCFKEVTCAQV